MNSLLNYLKKWRDCFDTTRKVWSIAYFQRHLLISKLNLNSIIEIDIEKLKKMEAEVLIFDKDNTLTAHMSNSFASQEIEKKFREIQKAFGYERVVILSNSFVEGYEKEVLAEIIQGMQYSERIQARVLQTKSRKPFNFEDVKEILNRDSLITGNDKIVIIGDRLFTDILLANLNGCFSIHVQPCFPESESIGIRIARYVENSIIK